MTRDEIIKFAKACGDDVEHTLPEDIDFLHRFAELVAANEREECAKLCESYDDRLETLRDADYQSDLAGRQAGAARCAFAIRSRSS